MLVMNPKGNICLSTNNTYTFIETTLSKLSLDSLQTPYNQP